MANGKYTVFAKDANIAINTLKSWLDGSQPTYKKIKPLLLYTGKSFDYFYPNDFHKEFDENNDIRIQVSDHIKAEYSKPRILKVVRKNKQTKNLSDKWFHNALDDILKNGEKSTIDAIKSNIREFRKKVIEVNFYNLINEMKKHKPKDGIERRRIWIMLSDLFIQEMEE